MFALPVNTGSISSLIFVTLSDPRDCEKFVRCEYFEYLLRVPNLLNRRHTLARTDTNPTVPSDQHARLARDASRALEQHRAHESLRGQAGEGGHKEPVDLPPAASKLIFQLLEEMGKGLAVTLLPTDAEITTEQAAGLPNVSRPFLVGMIYRGELPARMVSNQRRLPLVDVLAYKTAHRAKRLEALREMMALGQGLGLK